MGDDFWTGAFQNLVVVYCSAVDHWPFSNVVPGLQVPLGPLYFTPLPHRLISALPFLMSNCFSVRTGFDMTEPKRVKNKKTAAVRYIGDDFIAVGDILSESAGEGSVQVRTKEL